MIVRRETFTSKKIGITRYEIKRTSWWLFGIIPIYVNNKIVGKY